MARSEVFTCYWCGSTVEAGEQSVRTVIYFRDRPGGRPANQLRRVVECMVCCELLGWSYDPLAHRPEVVR